MRHIVALSVALLLVAVAGDALADEVVLRSGESIIGSPTIEGQTLRLVTPGGAVRTIPLREVERIRHNPGVVPARGIAADGVVAVPSVPVVGMVERQGLVPPVPVPCAPPVEPCPPDPCKDPCQEKCKWTGPWHLSIGLNWTQAGGNSDSIAFKGDAELTYEQGSWCMEFSGFYAYNESGGSVDTDRVFIDAQIDRRLAGRWYAFLKGSYDQNEPADLEYRWIGTAGIGNCFVKRDDFELRAEVGGGMTWEKRTGLDETADPSGYFGIDLMKEFVRAGKLVVDYDFLPNFNEFDLSLMRLDVRYELPLSTCLSLRLGLRLDYQFEPVDPTVEELDWLTSAGLAISF